MKNNEDNKNNAIINPFSPRYPSPPELFADRKDLLSQFRRELINSAKLLPPTPINYLILGDWGIGKTSLLYKLEDVSLIEFNDEINVITTRLSLNPIICKEWKTFCEALLTNIKNNSISNEKIRKKIFDELGRWDFKLKIPLLDLERDSGGLKTLDLIDELELLWNTYLKKSDVDIALICLDDVQYFLTADLSDAYLTLRNVFQELARRGCNYSLILTSSTSFWEILAEIAEPFRRFFKPLHLSTFDRKDLVELIEVRFKHYNLKLTIDDDVIDEIFSISLGHPYFIVYIMSEIMNRIGNNEVITRKLYDQTISDAIDALEREILQSRYNLASIKEKEVLRKIAVFDDILISPKDIKGIAGVNTHLSRLNQKGLITKKARGKYELFHPLFKNYLTKL